MSSESVEFLTREFYDWEISGRGWQSAPYPVRVEPSFSPFERHQRPLPRIDDGREPTWISRLLDALPGRKVETCTRGDEDEVGRTPYGLPAEEVSWKEFDVLSPSEVRIDERAVQAWLCSLSTCRYPVAFELWGSGGVSIHLACDEKDATTVVGQARAFFPGVIVRHATEKLKAQWSEVGECGTALEFGLGREFMVPLRMTWEGFDPLTALLAGLAQVPSQVAGLVQVIFEPARSPWAESILRAVTTRCGEPFFADAPEVTTLARQKISAPLFGVVVRIAACGADTDSAWETLRRIAGGLAILGTPNGNELVPLANDDDASLVDEVLRRETRRSGMLWSAAELACLIHPPDRSVQIHGLRRSLPDMKPAPAEILKDGVILGETEHRGQRIVARLPVEARLKHVHVIGASGTGKSTLLVNLILQDIAAGEGVGVIDPHGDLVDEVLKRVSTKRADDVILFDPANDDYVVGWNILRAHSPTEKEMLASDLVAVFRRLSTSWGDQMTAILGNAVQTFLESERGGTLLDLRRFLVDDEFREVFLTTVRDPEAVSFWQREFPLLIGKKPQAPILTRLDTFLRSRLVRDAVTEQQQPLDFRKIVDHRAVFLARLSQGAIGQENASLLGALIVSKFHQVSLTRQDQAAADRRPFFLYVDEFQDVAAPSMASLFSGVRKYRLGVTVAHQDLFQLHAKVPEVERAVLANAYTRICFRVAEDDARRLEKGIDGLVADDLMNLKTGQAICRIGRKEDAFQIRTARLEEPENGEQNRREIVRQSLERFGRPRCSLIPPVVVAPSLTVHASPTPQPTIVSVRPPQSSTPRPTGRAAREREAGRGGAGHKYLQELIRQWGQERGFRATVEHVLSSGGRVDVLLERDDVAVACEVAMTTSVEQEVENVRKCLTGSFPHVVVVSLKKAFLKQLEKVLDERLGAERSKVTLLAPEELSGFLDELAAAPEHDCVAGYAVRVHYRRQPSAETESRRRAMTDIIVQGLRRMRGTGT